MAVREEHNGFAIDQGIVDAQGAHRLRDPWKPVPEPERRGELYTSTRSPCFPGEDPESVMLDLMQQPGPAGGLATRVG